jgi:hypothetical protein
VLGFEAIAAWQKDPIRQAVAGLLSRQTGARRASLRGDERDGATWRERAHALDDDLDRLTWLFANNPRFARTAIVNALDVAREQGVSDDQASEAALELVIQSIELIRLATPNPGDVVHSENHAELFDLIAVSRVLTSDAKAQVWQKIRAGITPEEELALWNERHLSIEQEHDLWRQGLTPEEIGLRMFPNREILAVSEGRAQSPSAQIQYVNSMAKRSDPAQAHATVEPTVESAETGSTAELDAGPRRRYGAESDWIKLRLDLKPLEVKEADGLQDDYDRQFGELCGARFRTRWKANFGETPTDEDIAKIRSILGAVESTVAGLGRYAARLNKEHMRALRREVEAEISQWRDRVPLAGLQQRSPHDEADESNPVQSESGRVVSSTRSVTANQPRVPIHPRVRNRWAETWRYAQPDYRRNKTATYIAGWISKQHPELKCSPETLEKICRAGHAGLLNDGAN